MFVMSSSTQSGISFNFIDSYLLPAVNPVHIPLLSTTGRLSSTKASVNLDKTALNLPGDFITWAEFHNGVAAGLKISRFEESEITQVFYSFM